MTAACGIEEEVESTQMEEARGEEKKGVVAVGEDATGAVSEEVQGDEGAGARATSRVEADDEGTNGVG